MGRPRRILRALPAIALAWALATARPARADDPPPGPGAAMQALSAPLRLTLPGEPTGPAALDASMAVLPLRLALLGDAFPVGRALGDDACASRGDPSGNSSYGFAAQQQAFLPLTPQLTLHGFSRAGCPLDAVAGAGLTFFVPLPRQMWLVASAGALTTPPASGAFSLRSDARLDLVLRSTPTSALAVGVGRRGVTLSGLW